MADIHDHATSSHYAPIPGVKVLGICGAARHGKDTLAKLLMAVVPNAERFAFSDAIAVLARAEHGMTARNPVLMQEVGYEYRRGNPSIWLRCLYGAIEDRAPGLAIITGVRFPDEAAMIRQMGGALVRVVRTEHDGQIYRATDRDLNHATEREIEHLPADAMVAAPSGDFDTLQRFGVCYVGDQLGVPVNVP